QDQARDVFVGLVLDHLDALARDHQFADVVERDVPALRRVVETAVRIFFYQAFFAHGAASILFLRENACSLATARARRAVRYSNDADLALQQTGRWNGRFVHN